MTDQTPEQVTVHERDGWKWINRCPRCDAETFLEDDDLWICENGHACDMANQEIVKRPLPRMTDQTPRTTQQPNPADVVQVLMTEDMARRFEERCLGTNTRGMTRLSPPLLFEGSDIPTYIIEVVGL